MSQFQQPIAVVTFFINEEGKFSHNIKLPVGTNPQIGEIVGPHAMAAEFDLNDTQG